ncbi:Cysteine rich receptor like kinase [Parasponia andersonii]|uniref:Cysteine rich receptor like kinase n=1 Tax=Parasponia andersonii TaxID=3476 RepID=A0A2P5C9K0_PARAD|nr:Cysteine rich receptor like kinase [Parasponia andersonii]
MPTPFLLLYHLIFLLVGLVHGESAPPYPHPRCSTTANFTLNSSYKSSLNLLLSSLSSNATYQTFYNATVGSVHGLFLCRGDIRGSECRDCVAAAANDIVKACPLDIEPIIWYDVCMLRYSNRSFFGAWDQYPNDYVLEGANIVPDSDRFDRLVAETVRKAAADAAGGGPGEKKFATREANFSEFQKLYSLVQCTPDISGTDCQNCLHTAIAQLPICCGGRDRVTYLYPSCYLRYDRYQFYSNTTVPTSPPVAIPAERSTIATRTILFIVVPSSVFFALLLLLGYHHFAIGKRKYNTGSLDEQNARHADIITMESLQCDLATIEAATSKFSSSNKLGQGGFGEVYKGILPDGREIAVKRLIRSSGDGVGEFKNEVVLLAMLQHRNLVRLLGFCLEGEEKLLVYEFVPNKSLDYFLYDPTKQGLLDWSTRYKIIGGVARGILYLHEDSRLRIIHRDLKPNNILLDVDYEPKISDFGIARLIRTDQTRADTLRIAGTFGYMCPEYVLRGQLSLKSDVYSFGILMLEIISGKRNGSFNQSHSDGGQDFLSYAWKLWHDGTPWKLLDQTLLDSYSENEVSRCVHIGLLCVQENAEERPKMATIVLMLNTSSITLPPPRRPSSYTSVVFHNPDIMSHSTEN